MVLAGSWQHEADVAAALRRLHCLLRRLHCHKHTHPNLQLLQTQLQDPYRSQLEALLSATLCSGTTHSFKLANASSCNSFATACRTRTAASWRRCCQHMFCPPSALPTATCAPRLRGWPRSLRTSASAREAAGQARCSTRCCSRSSTACMTGVQRVGVCRRTVLCYGVAALFGQLL
jgi:hypothetical protein